MHGWNVHRSGWTVRFSAMALDKSARKGVHIPSRGLRWRFLGRLSDRVLSNAGMGASVEDERDVGTVAEAEVLCARPRAVGTSTTDGWDDEGNGSDS